MTGLPQATDDIPEPVSVELLADTSEPKPGESFRVGVLFNIERGWYIFWKNPGTSGLPTKVDFHTPPPLSTGDTHWPVPEIFSNRGAYLDYGYKDSVLLWTDVKVPPDASFELPVTIEAEVNWVSCRGICIPDSATLLLTLREPTKSNEKIFAEWDSTLPIVIDGSDIPFESSLSSKETSANQTLCTLKLVWEETPGNIELIPMPVEGARVKNISYSSDSSSNEQTIHFELTRTPPEQSPLEKLPVLIVFTNKYGKRTGLEHTLDLHADN